MGKISEEFLADVGKADDAFIGSEADGAGLTRMMELITATGNAMLALDRRLDIIHPESADDGSFYKRAAKDE